MRLRAQNHSTRSGRLLRGVRAARPRHYEERHSTQDTELNNHDIGRNAHVERDHHATRHHGQRKQFAPAIDTSIAVPVGDDGTKLRMRQQLTVEPRRTASESESSQQEEWRRGDERERNADDAAGRANPTHQNPKHSHPDPLRRYAHFPGNALFRAHRPAQKSPRSLREML